MNTVDQAAVREAAAATLTRSFLPLHKRAFGTATGVAAALIVFGATVIVQLRHAHDVPLWLLEEYFAGYSVTWGGAFIGAAWAFFAGFVMGWFLAFARNFLVGMLIIYIRTKAEIAQTRDLLDHI
jgi:hypothetical protein